MEKNDPLFQWLSQKQILHDTEDVLKSNKLKWKWGGYLGCTQLLEVFLWGKLPFLRWCIFLKYSCYSIQTIFWMEVNEVKQNSNGQWSETLVQTIFFFCSMLEPSSAGACLIFEILQGRNFSQNSLPLWSIILPIVPKCSPNSRILCVSSGFSFAVKENLSPKRHKKLSKSPISSYT